MRELIKMYREAAREACALKKEALASGEGLSPEEVRTLLTSALENIERQGNR